jgi:hypothetical protein
MPHKTVDEYGQIHRDYEIVCKNCGKKTRLTPDEYYCEHCGKIICVSCLGISYHTETECTTNGNSGWVICNNCEHEIVSYDF